MFQIIDDKTVSLERYISFIPKSIHSLVEMVDGPTAVYDFFVLPSFSSPFLSSFLSYRGSPHLFME